MTGKARKISIVAGITLVTLLAVLLVAPGFIDWNQYRDRVSALASSQTGVDVIISGDLSARILPFPSLGVKDVLLRAPGGEGADEIGRLAGLDIDVSLGSLLAGEPEVTRFTLRGPEFSLEQGSDGGWKISGWPELESAEPSDGDDADTAMTSFVLSDLQIEQGALTLRPSGKQAVAVTGISLEASGKLPEGPFVFDGTSEVKGQPVSFDGRWQQRPDGSSSSIGLNLAIAGGTVEISGAVRDSGQMSGRLKAGGDNLQQFSNGLLALAGEAGQVGSLSLPFAFDASVESSGKMASLKTRQFSVGKSKGEIIVEALQGDRLHLSGDIRFSQLFLDELEKAYWNIPAAENARESQGQSAFLFDLEGGADAVFWNGESVQRLDFILSIDGDKLSLTKAQAILPGGGTASASGEWRAGAGSGRLVLDGGDARPLFAWAGVPVSRFRQDRLKTLKLDATFASQADRWTLDVPAGTLDATDFTVNASGSQAAETRVALKANLLDVDAYQPVAAGKQSAGAGDSEIPAMTLDVQIAEMTAGGKRLSNVSFAGRTAGNQLAIDRLLATGPGGSQIGAEGQIGNLQDMTGIDLVLSGLGLPMPAVASMADMDIRDLPAPLRDEVDLDGSLSGSLDNLGVRGKISFTDGSLDLSGNVSELRGEAPTFDLAGTLKHSETAPWTAIAGLRLTKRAGPVDLAFDVKGPATSPAISARGQFAGGNLVLDTSSSDDGIEGTVRFDRENARAMSPELNNLFGQRRLSVPLEISASFRTNAGRWSTDIAGFRLGEARLDGQVAGDEAGIVGNLKLVNLEMGARPAAQGAASKRASEGWSEKRFPLQQLRTLKARFEIDLENASLYGQSLERGKLVLDAGEGQLSATLQDATMNNGPVRLFVQGKATNTLALGLQGKIDRLVLDSFASTVAGVKPISGVSVVEMNLAATGRNQKEMMESLSGTMTSDANAGTLNFVSVLGLANQLRSADSGRAFIAGLGQSLRGGVTTTSKMTANVELKNGVATLAPFQAMGDWGQLDLSGDTNLVTMVANISGLLKVTNPADTPDMPVSFKGPLDDMTADWKTRTLQNFFLSGLQRKMRSDLMQEGRERDQAGEKAASPAEEVVGGIFELLKKKKKKEEDETDPDNQD